MELQNFEKKNLEIKEKFLQLKKESPDTFNKSLKFSWSNWGFGMEPLQESIARLTNFGVKYIELHGNHYGNSLGYKQADVKRLCKDYGIKVSGICGMFSPDNDLSCNSAIKRQAAIDYIKRELEFGAEVGAKYLLIVPGAVGRPKAYDDSEFERSVETLQLVGDYFVQYNIKGAIEPIRSAEVSFIHTVNDAIKYIKAVNHPGINHINGDAYHMSFEEAHIGKAILEAGNHLTNLHMADSNRCALGEGFMDLDTIIMSLYINGYNLNHNYVTPEPLGPGGDPYPAMFGKPNKNLLDKMVEQSVNYFKERENYLIKHL